MKRKSSRSEPPGKKANKSALKDFDFSFGEAHLPNPVSTKVDSLTNLTEYFKNKSFSGTQHLDFAVSTGCKDTVGCYAKKAFRNGDTYLTVPQACMIGLNVVLEHATVKFIVSTARKQGCLHQISVEQLFWTAMVLLRDDTDSDTNNNHAIYLHSLADISPSILSWDSSLRIAFVDTNLQIALDELNQSLLQFIDLIHSLIPTITDANSTNYISTLQQLTYEKLLWAAGHYLSRRYPMHLAPAITAEQEQLLSELRREHNFGNIGTMVPLLDILNHNHDHDWLDMHVNDHGHLQVNCNRSVAAGQELFSNYGHLSNGQLLFAYGYAIENNPYDEYLLKLKLPGDGKNLFALQRGGWDAVPKELLVALKTMIGLSNANQAEVVSDEESLEVFYSFLLDKMQRMKATHSLRAEHLRSFGITLSIPFPDNDSTDEDNELIIPPHMTKPTITVTATSSAAEAVEVEKAKYIAYYLVGQFEVIMELLVDMSRMFAIPEEGTADMDEEEEEDEEDDDNDDEEDGEEDENEE